jgi:hypothetical protein
LLLQEQEEKQEARSSIIGQDLQINEAHLAGIQDTEDYDKMLSTMYNYRNRIQEICEWLKKECSDYAELHGGVVLITDAQKRDRSFIAHKSTLDLKYDGLNVEFIKIFMSNRKKKESGKIFSHGHIPKYREYGLPQRFHGWNHCGSA